jgi:hypothetical protein
MAMNELLLTASPSREFRLGVVQHLAMCRASHIFSKMSLHGVKSNIINLRKVYTSRGHPPCTVVVESRLRWRLKHEACQGGFQRISINPQLCFFALCRNSVQAIVPVGMNHSGQALHYWREYHISCATIVTVVPALRQLHVRWT